MIGGAREPARLGLAARFARRGAAHGATLVAVAALAAAACGEREPAQGAAPPLPRAAFVLEPARIGVGEVATLEIAVATPPGHAPRPLAIPEAPAGLWILGVDELPVEREKTRWLHRTRVRLRAREVGPVVWPAGRVEIQAPDGETRTLALEPLAIEVVSVLPEYPDRLIPFGVREPAERAAADGWGALAGAAAGAAVALASVALARALARRRAGRVEASTGEPEAPAAGPPWEEARAALARARDLVSGDPFLASDLAARALRRYASRRFSIGAEACTSEELAAAAAPFAAATRWPLFVAALRALDAHRFRPRGDPEAREAAASGLPGALAQALRFVEETLPPGTAA